MAIRIDAVVKADSRLAEIQEASGRLVAVESLGPGVVREMGAGDAIKVHWMSADLDAWVPAQDLQPVGEGVRLVTVKTFDWRGRAKSVRYHMVKGVGLRYHWVVEMRPKNVIRATRPDGNTWTFEWYPLFREAHPVHTMLLPGCQLDDDQAEALTVAEIAAR